MWLFTFSSKELAIEKPSYHKDYLENYKIYTIPMPDEPAFAGERIPVERFYVKEALERELTVNTYWHSSTIMLIKKSHRWLPVIEPILKEYNIPDDFKYIAIIESGLSNVVSPAGARGIWQFMTESGEQYDLEINKEVDERYHIIKATRAACRYFKKAYERYNNWTLAAASYNAGTRRISESLKEQLADNYYDLLLNDETARYIYRIVAARTIITNPSAYGFQIRDNDMYSPLLSDTITIDQPVADWAVWAREHHMSYRELKYFNPWLRKPFLTNHNSKKYQIAIPAKGTLPWRETTDNRQNPQQKIDNLSENE